MEHYGDKLRAARKAAGLSVEDATYEARALMGRKITRKTVERYELHPGSPERVDLEIMVALCRVYGVDVADVSPVIAERARRMASALLVSNRHPNMGVTERYTPQGVAA